MFIEYKGRHLFVKSQSFEEKMSFFGIYYLLKFFVLFVQSVLNGYL